MSTSGLNFHFDFSGGVMLQEVIQPEGFKTAKLGQTVDIKCSTNSKYNSRVWYKLGSNRRLQLLASTNVLFTPNAPIDDHYTVNSSKNENILTIKDVTVKDVGTYFCGISNINDVLFGSGTVLEIEGEPVQSFLQSPEDIRAKPGDSVTLSCSFTSRHCPQEHISAVWVRSGSTSSEIVSWDYGKKIFCESSSCVYNLTLKNISSAEDGTYLCVVTACGEIMIGTGTRIQLNGNKCFLHVTIYIVPCCLNHWLVIFTDWIVKIHPHLSLIYLSLHIYLLFMLGKSETTE
uniref:Ig-like domain-containing protein n=1 Tax=Neogobius melanostomus TaxID=47308 RepID=A0A8C6TML2_9GOBI